MSAVVLCASLVSALVVFGVPSEYPPPASWALSLVLMGVIGISAWRVGASAIRDKSDVRGTLATAAALMILPIALFSLLPGLGPPWEATPAENQIRYLILFLDSLAITCGFILLRQAVRETGEGFHSALGFAAIVLAGPLYGIFTLIQLEFYRTLERGDADRLPPWIAVLDELSIILLFFGVLLTYLATAAFAASLGRNRWLGRAASRIIVVTNLVAASLVGIRVVEAVRSPQDPIWGFGNWYAVPGFVLAIPAIPWLVPCALGVLLLRRAGTTVAP